MVTMPRGRGPLALSPFFVSLASGYAPSRQSSEVRRRERLARYSNPPVDQPTAVAFLDESGSISMDRIFAVGCLKLGEPSVVLRALQKLRDTQHWYGEIHFADVTRDSLAFYKAVANLVSSSDAEFSCFVADRESADPVARFGSHWKAYEKLAEQLLLGSIRPYELVTVLADNYSTPDHFVFEQDVRSGVNNRLDRLAVTSVCRLDSKAADPLQLVDLLTSAVAFEFRQNAGLAKETSTKGRLAAYVRSCYGVSSFLGGCDAQAMNVKIYGPSKPDGSN